MKKHEHEHKDGCCGTGGEKKGMCCPITGCPVKHVLLAAVLVFAVMFGFEWLFHGVYMMPDYEATADLWRSEEEMMGMMHICIIRKALMALAIAGLFCWLGRDCGGIKCPVKGAKFGLLIGLLLGASMFGSYVWMPIPLDMAVKWLVGDVVMGVILGAALGLACGKMCKK